MASIDRNDEVQPSSILEDGKNHISEEKQVSNMFANAAAATGQYDYSLSSRMLLLRFNQTRSMA